MAKIQVYKRFSATKLRSEFGFRVVASNGEIIAASEGYVTKENAKRGALGLIDTVSEMQRNGFMLEDA